MNLGRSALKMNKFKVTKLPAVRDAFANYPYKNCKVCNTELPTELPYFRVGFPGYLGDTICCSETCANMVVLQNMDNIQPRAAKTTKWYNEIYLY